ncbi:beta-ketoacyl-[acyl-carrier-protein] synthase family protein [Phycisphaera mikurensis]|nr:beta-ketoacyl-[acyl-carrier-protein] synthase family protein [Phycisphaera mikurensis]MBB6442558.1 3-oxoacyl-[acyl-carrier-protein] synthase II [Phycisphaera mikurensis]
MTTPADARTSSTDPIVITGCGWVTPLGDTLDGVWKRMLNAQSGAAAIRGFDASTFPTTFAAEVDPGWSPSGLKHPKLHETAGRHTRFALGAASRAWEQSGLDGFDGLDRERLGLYLGAGEGTIDLEHYVSTTLAAWDADAGAVDARAWAAEALRQFDADREVEQEPNMPLTHLALEFGAMGPASNCLTACAASTQAIGEACAVLARGEADVMLSGGAHTMIHPFGVTGFNRLTALSNRNDSPETASRPFSADRDGFVMGEGAGILVLERRSHAEAREAEILAEIGGYGATADAYRITDIHPEGRGAAAAMRQALEMAGLEPAGVDWIAAHGTGTKENDSIETRAIKSVFAGADGADLAAVPPVSSIKSMLGHLIAAAGAVQAIACVLAIRDGVLPPTANLTTPGPECDLDYVPNEARRKPVTAALSNSFGFGGQNNTLLIRSAQSG